MISREANAAAVVRLLARMRDNARGFGGAHWPWLGWFVLAAAADGASTMWFMHHDGTDAEFHPVIRLVSALAGPVAGPILGKLGQFVAGLGLAVFFRRQATLILVVTSLLYLWAAWYNVWGHVYYTPRLLDWFG